MVVGKPKQQGLPAVLKAGKRGLMVSPLSLSKNKVFIFLRILFLSAIFISRLPSLNLFELSLCLPTCLKIFAPSTMYTHAGLYMQTHGCVYNLLSPLRLAHVYMCLELTIGTGETIGGSSIEKTDFPSSAACNFSSRVWSLV